MYAHRSLSPVRSGSVTFHFFSIACVFLRGTNIICIRNSIIPILCIVNLISYEKYTVFRNVSGTFHRIRQIQLFLGETHFPLSKFFIFLQIGYWHFGILCYNQFRSAGHAGVAHPVERHLAKVEVASSSLVTRSIKKKTTRSVVFFFIMRWCRLDR